ncbi:hypothetical protein HPB50_014692 [Hyalomma asiaticum]|uniref:Uncharacterized protein n=1 Tax=Hyalomma asiaticum TaxID=266040 RepID=A0ACB7SW44_HYAAI|nr:hypothetical protein HPB50_014692 [Hyalomma asiaticum]
MAAIQEPPPANVARVVPRMSPAIRINEADAQTPREQPLSLLPRIMFGSALFCLCVMLVVVMGTISNWPSRSELEGDYSSQPEILDSRASVATGSPKRAVKVTAAALEDEATRRRAKGNGTKPFTTHCSQFSFTYCAEGQSGAQRHYFDWTIGSCASTPHGGPLLCNRGRNRRDMKHPLWFWDGDSCVEWNFYRGNCMRRTRGHELTSKAACLETCKLESANDSLGVPPACKAPRSAPCDTAKMRFPFFAVPKGGGGGGSFECVEANAKRLQRQLCLAPGNSFDSIEACDTACKREGSEKI